MNPTTHRDTTYHSIYLALSIAVLAAACVLRVQGEGHVQVPGLSVPLPDTCYFKRLFGVGCPGCGLTRCFISVAHGEFVRAWRFNPGGFLFFLMVVAQIPYRLAQIWRIRHYGQEWRPARLTAGLGFLLVGTLVIQWLVRFFV